MITNRRLGLASLVLAGMLWVGMVPAAQAQSGSLLKSSPKVVAVFKEVVANSSQSTVRIVCDKKDSALGTIVHPDGYILTKYSQVKGTPVCKLRDGREFEACVVSFDERHDVALLKIECLGMKVIEWCESKVAPVGHWVASPGTGEEPVCIGVVAVATRNVPVGKTPPPVKVPGAGTGYLGIGLAPDESVAKISQVMAGGGAEKAGLKVNDIILTVQGEEVRDQESLINVLMRHKAGDVVKLVIKRDGKEMSIEATLGKRPANASRGDFQNSLGSELSERRTGFPTILHHDSVIKPTDCGGPLVDLEGKVIGINIARVGRTESNAIPSEVIRPVVEKLMPEKVSAPKPVKE